MKKLTLLSLLTLNFFFFSCNDEKKATTEAASTPIHTLVFIDKTESVNVSNDFIKDKYEKALANLIEENFTKQGDKFEIYFVHENTAKGRSLSLISRTEKPLMDNLNPTDLETAKTSYDLAIRRERGIVRQQAFQKLMEKNAEVSNMETNLTQSLPIIAKAAEMGSIVKVYYLSDMVESVKTGRDFHKNPPKSLEDAEKIAKEDAEKLNTLSLGNISVSMILPFAPTSSSQQNNPSVTHYWQTLFEALGAAEVREF